MKKQKQRHETAKTNVEVYRLFKVHDMAQAMEMSSDGVVVNLARQISTEATAMLQSYYDEQQKLIDAKKGSRVRHPR